MKNFIEKLNIKAKPPSGLRQAPGKVAARIGVGVLNFLTSRLHPAGRGLPR